MTARIYPGGNSRVVRHAREVGSFVQTWPLGQAMPTSRIVPVVSTGIFILAKPLAIHNGFLTLWLVASGVRGI